MTAGDILNITYDLGFPPGPYQNCDRKVVDITIGTFIYAKLCNQWALTEFLPYGAKE